MTAAAAVVDAGLGHLRVAPQFMTERNGRPYVLFAGLLDLFHRQNVTGSTKGRIETTLIQAPSPMNGYVAIVTAEVRRIGAGGEVVAGPYSGIGDASPENVSKAMANALVRMAETRAKGRALRDALNISAVAVEEVGPVPGEPEAPALPEDYVDIDGVPTPRLTLLTWYHGIVANCRKARIDTGRVWADDEPDLAAIVEHCRWLGQVLREHQQLQNLGTPGGTSAGRNTEPAARSRQPQQQAQPRH